MLSRLLQRRCARSGPCLQQSRCLATRTKVVEVATEPSKQSSSSTVGSVGPRRQRYRLSHRTGLKWESVVGLEVHAQILSKSKLFSGAPSNTSTSSALSSPPNTAVAHFDAALPGSLPVLNKRINLVSHFDRKHYFYADLPAGYQITQHRSPIAVGGAVEFTVLKYESVIVSGYGLLQVFGYLGRFRSATVPRTYSHSVGVTQLQLEQDSGKSLHDDEMGRSLIDLNRAGVGLMEIVFEPHLFDGEEAAALVKELALILRLLGTCTCQMEAGSLRVDANVSVRPYSPPGSEDALLGTRTEIKNLNSLRSVVGAVEYEVGRQVEVLEGGGTVENETRGYDPAARETTQMRDKEVKQDYRFMPEPNLPPLRLHDSDLPGKNEIKRAGAFDVAKSRGNLPELPQRKRERFVGELGLSPENASRVVVGDGGGHGVLDFFEEGVDRWGARAPPVLANLLLNDVRKLFREEWEEVTEKKEPGTEMSIGGLTPKALSRLSDLKHSGELPHNLVAAALREVSKEDAYITDVDQLVKERGWLETARDPEAIAAEVKEALSRCPKLVSNARKALAKGKKKNFKRALADILTEAERSAGARLDMRMVAEKLENELMELAAEKKDA